MPQPWEPEIAIDEPSARQLVLDHFAELRPVGTEFPGRGWDNLAIAIDGA